MGEWRRRGYAWNAAPLRASMRKLYCSDTPAKAVFITDPHRAAGCDIKFTRHRPKLITVSEDMTVWSGTWRRGSTKARAGSR